MDDEVGIPSLPPPVVPAEVYTEDYYASCCAGHEEWSRSGGAEAHNTYLGSLRIAGLLPGEVVVDIGTGRGELLAVAVENGAEKAIGIEYSESALAMAHTTIAQHGVGDRAEVILADARRIPLDDGSADLVTMLDVVEHLSPEELNATLREAHRLLRVGGRVLIHTMPNREIYDVTYKWLRRLWPGGWRWPRDPRNKWEHLMHVNEQTVASLRDTLRGTGFNDVDVSLGQWIHADFVPSQRARNLYPRLARYRATRRFGSANMFGKGVR